MGKKTASASRKPAAKRAGEEQCMAEWGTFSPPDIVPHLSPVIVVLLQSQMGGLNQNLSALLLRMSKLQSPLCSLRLRMRSDIRGGGVRGVHPPAIVLHPQLHTASRADIPPPDTGTKAGLSLKDFEFPCLIIVSLLDKGLVNQSSVGRGHHGAVGVHQSNCPSRSDQRR